MSVPDKQELIELFEYARPRVIQSMELRHCPMRVSTIRWTTAVTFVIRDWSVSG